MKFHTNVELDWPRVLSLFLMEWIHVWPLHYLEEKTIVRNKSCISPSAEAPNNLIQNIILKTETYCQHIAVMSVSFMIYHITYYII